MVLQEGITKALTELRQGSPGARDELVHLIYVELKKLASSKLRALPAHHTLQPTALVNEAYLKLMQGDGESWENRTHFFAAAAAAMRSILVDHARRRMAQKRGGEWKRVSLNEDIDGTEELSTQVLEVHEALEGLQKAHPRKSRIVELLFFGGLSVAETARIVGISDRMVKKHWRFARAWLAREIVREH